MSQRLEFDITGMTCDHCVHAVTNAIQDVEGVTRVVVSLNEKKATVEGEGVQPSLVVAAVEEEGYEARPREA